MIIKVCGLRDPQNIRDVSALGIDWTGFIFYHKSPRRFNLMDNGQLTMDNSKKVFVFVNASMEEMMDAVNTYKPDYLQLHGDESPELCSALRERGISLIKAFSVSSEEDIEKTKHYEGFADYFLFDTKCEGYGGSGKQFDWSVLSAYKGDTPFLLSGGINPGSVAAINGFSHPRFAGIDLNSGFETEPGIKDIAKLKFFLHQLTIND
jgi:phosphoribosylanthranilate isomerase